MPIFKRELAFEADRRGTSGGDWWHLVLDTDSPGLYVEHTWQHENTHLQGDTSSGAQRFGINDFLTLAQDRPAHSVLVTALSDIFREAKQA
jgi:hypothetical protein